MPIATPSAFALSASQPIPTPQSLLGLVQSSDWEALGSELAILSLLPPESDIVERAKLALVQGAKGGYSLMYLACEPKKDSLAIPGEVLESM